MDYGWGIKKNRHDFITTEIQQPQSLFIFYFLYVQYERRGRVDIIN